MWQNLVLSIYGWKSVPTARAAQLSQLPASLQLKPHEQSNQRIKMWKLINDCSLKLINIRVVCYIAIDNWDRNCFHLLNRSHKFIRHIFIFQVIFQAPVCPPVHCHKTWIWVSILPASYNSALTALLDSIKFPCCSSSLCLLSGRKVKATCFHFFVMAAPV